MRGLRAWAGWLILLGVFCIGFGTWLPLPVAAQASDITLVVRPAFQGMVRPGGWLPVTIEVTNNGVDRTAEIVVGTANGPFQSTFVELPGGGRKGAILYAFIYGSPRQLGVRVLVDGTEVTTASARLQPVTEGLLVGVIGERELRLPAQLADGIRVTSVPVPLADLPPESLGLSPFDALIITDVAANEITPDQQRALQSWVQRGGTLLVNGDVGIARTLSSLPRELIPATVGALAAPLTDPSVTPVTLTPSASAPEVYPITLPLISTPLPLAYGKRFGNGQTVVLAFDLAAPEVVNWSGWRELWQALLPPPSFIPSGLGFGTKLYSTYVEENLASALTTLPALDLPSLNLIGILLACYLVVVGPVTYLVLRRLDRLAWGWVVVPVLTGIFTAGAYGIGYDLRGGEVIVSQITLIDANAPTSAHERSFIGIFSPDRYAYRLQATESVTMVRPVSVQGPWSSPPLTNGTYVQGSDDNLVVENLEISQWSMQAIASDRMISAPLITAQITVNGDTVQGEVTNRSERTLEDVVLAYGEQIALINALAPGEQRSATLERPSHAFDGISLSYLIYGPQFEAMSRVAQPVSPTLQLRSRIIDSLYGYGAITRGAQPLLLAWYQDTETSLIPVDRRATMQHLTLVRGAVRLQVTDEIKLNSNGFIGSFEQTAGTNSPCYNGNLLGIAPDLQPTIMRFTLPADLIGLQPSALLLNLRSDSFWSGEIELYDWITGSWTPIPTDAFQSVALDIPQPDHFLSSQGVIRLRLKNRDFQNFTCVYADPVVRGRLP